MGTEVVRVDPAAPASAALGRAADVLRAGGLVAFPTETFYGLGAAALDSAAVAGVFAVKGRPESKPVLVLVDSVEMVERLVEVSDRARRLMARHWPGALTLVMRARRQLPAQLTAGTGAVGVRLSPHPVARGLVRALGGPVTAPSANRSGAAPPTTAEDVLRAFRGGIALVLDGGSTPGGPPSTVIDLSVDPPHVIRQGAVQVDL
jgi:L-threonylcarbamoyladenylate synthase